MANWAYTMYKRQGRKLIFGPYECPICAKSLLNIRVNEENKTAVAKCSCGFKMTLDYFPSFQPIDYYNKIVDQLHRARNP